MCRSSRASCSGRHSPMTMDTSQPWRPGRGLGNISGMEIARLVLEYVKALVWPVAAVTALVVLRRHIPHLVARMESWRIKAGAFEIEGTARAAEAVEKDFEAAQALAEPLGLALPDLELPEREFR